MKSYETKFFDSIESARIELYGSNYRDPETGVDYEFPAKNRETYAKSYDYCMISLNTYIKIEETLNEFDLIKCQIQHSQDFVMENDDFSTDFILNFSYKNWIIRLNIIAEQLLFLINHVYQLRLPKEDLVNKVF